MSRSFPPFIKWGDYKSEDENKPDVLILQVADPEIRENLYSSYVPVVHNDNGERKEKNLPLHQHDHWNRKLLKDYLEKYNLGQIRQNTRILVKTWLRKSKRSAYLVRDFTLEILGF